MQHRQVLSHPDRSAIDARFYNYLASNADDGLRYHGGNRFTGFPIRLKWDLIHRVGHKYGRDTFPQRALRTRRSVSAAGRAARGHDAETGRPKMEGSPWM